MDVMPPIPVSTGRHNCRYATTLSAKWDNAHAGRIAVHALAGNLTQELLEVPDRGHDMSAAGKVVLAAILAKRGDVRSGVRSLAFVMRDPLREVSAPVAEVAVAGIASSPRCLHELPPTGLSRGVSFAGSTRGGGGGNLARFVQSSGDGPGFGVCL